MSRKRNGRRQEREAGRNLSRRYGVIGAAVVAVVAVGALVLASITGGNTAAAESNAASAERAQLTGIVGDVSDLDFATAYAGKVVVVNYMAGWCRPCWAEIPGFIEVYEEFKGRGLEMIGISLQTPREQTQTMIDQLDIPYAVYEDLDGDAALNRFRLTSMPTTLLFSDGRLIHRLDGEVSAPVLRSIVEDAL